jgi:CHRD domain
VLPVLLSAMVSAAIFFSVGAGNIFASTIFVIGADGKIQRGVEVEAAVTGNAINGLTPTGKINSKAFPSSLGGNLNFEDAILNDLSLPSSVSELEYFLDSSTVSRGTLFRFSTPNSWVSTILSFSPSVQVGSAVAVKNGTQTVAAGTFQRPVRNYDNYDVFLSGRFVVPPVFNNDELRSLAEVKFFPAENRLNFTISTSLDEPCTGVTLNRAAEGVNGEVIAQIPFQTSGNNCETADFNLTLTTQQVQLLRGNQLYLTTLTASQPAGINRGQLENPSIGGDFSGDNRADLALFRPSNQIWYVQDIQNGQFNATRFGSATDKLVAADYDNDGKSDFAVFRNENGLGYWNIRNSSDGSLRSVQWGLSTDTPLPVNFDGDTKIDLAVFRAGVWYIRKMGDIIKPLAEGEEPDNNSLNYQIIQWGTAGDKPLVADFNGDGIDELAVYRPSNGVWYIYNVRNNTYEIKQFGLSGDIPTAKDFDGDMKADLGIFRQATGTWYILNSFRRNVTIRQFGLNGDIPVAADYDRDGVSDIAVFRPSDGVWYRLNSSDNKFSANRFGLNGDIPAVSSQ